MPMLEPTRYFTLRADCGWEFQAVEHGRFRWEFDRVGNRRKVEAGLRTAATIGGLSLTATGEPGVYRTEALGLVLREAGRRG